MYKKLTKLTKEQEKLIPIIREQWLGIGLSTHTNKKEAEEGVKEAYSVANLPIPKIFIWLRSPFEGAIAAASLKLGDQVWDQVWAQVRAQVWDQVWAQVRAQVWAQVRAQVWAQVGAQVGDQVRAQVGDQVRAQVGDQVWDQVRAQVGAQVGDQVGAQVRAQVGDQVWAQVWAQVGDQVGAQVETALYGSHDAGWLSFYWFFEQCGIKTSDKLNGLMRVARNAGWWWPFKETVILTENPIILKRDDRNRLHCEDGPAIAYSDGWGVYAIHGVRIPEKIIKSPLSITIEEIKNERNTEIKRIMREYFGQSRYLTETKAKIIDVDSISTMPDGTGEIIRALFKDNENRSFFVGSDGSTSRTYYMEVAPTVKTCKEAHKFLSGFDESKIIAQS